MLAQLNFKDYYIEEFSFSCNRDYKPGGGQPGIVGVDFDLKRRAENPLEFMISMTIEVNKEEAAFRVADCRIILKLTGFFSFIEGTEESIIKKMIAPNGLAMLYGVARGLVSQSTAMGWHGKFVLPSLNFHEIIREKSESSVKVKKKANPSKGDRAVSSPSADPKAKKAKSAKN